jgi:hypothetical protein
MAKKTADWSGFKGDGRKLHGEKMSGSFAIESGLSKIRDPKELQEEIQRFNLSESSIKDLAQKIEEEQALQRLEDFYAQQEQEQLEQEVLEGGTSVQKGILQEQGAKGLLTLQEKQKRFKELEGKKAQGRMDKYSNYALGRTDKAPIPLPGAIPGQSTASIFTPFAKFFGKDGPYQKLIDKLPFSDEGKFNKFSKNLVKGLPETFVELGAGLAGYGYSGIAGLTDTIAGTDLYTLSDTEEKEYNKLKKEIDAVQRPVLDAELKKQQEKVKEVQNVLDPIKELYNLKYAKGAGDARYGRVHTEEYKAKRDRRIAELEAQYGEVDLEKEVDLLKDIEYFHSEAGNEYENAIKQEKQSGWTNYWDGFVEDKMSIASITQGIRGLEIQDKIEKGEKLSATEEAWLEARDRMLEAKGGDFNTSSAYKTGKGVRHSGEYILEAFTSRGLGRVVGGAAKSLGATTKFGTVGNTLSSPFGMSKTYTMGIDKKLSSIEKVGFEGEEKYMSTDAQKNKFLQTLENDIIPTQQKFNVIDAKINKKMQNGEEPSEEELEEWSKYGNDLTKLYSLRSGLIDEEGNLKKGEWSLLEGLYSGYTENLIESFTERIAGGFIQKGMSSMYGKLAKNRVAKSLMDTKVGRGIDKLDTWQKSGRLGLETSKVGRLSKDIFRTTGPNKIVHSLPTELMEEWVVQTLPSYREDYIKKMSELANPDFHLDVALQTLLIGGKSSVIGAGRHYSMLGLSEDYKEAYNLDKNKKQALKKGFTAIDKSIKDEQVSRQIAMATAGSTFSVEDYAREIALLRDPKAPNLEGLSKEEREKKAMVLEERQFLNGAILALETGTQNYFRGTLAKMTRNKKLSPELKTIAEKTLKKLDAFENIIDKNRDLENGGYLTGLEINKSVLKDNQQTLKGLIDGYSETFANKLQDFSNANPGSNLTVDNIFSPEKLSEEDAKLSARFLQGLEEDSDAQIFLEANLLREYAEATEKNIDGIIEYEKNPKNQDEIKKRQEAVKIANVASTLPYTTTLPQVIQQEQVVDDLQESEEKTELLKLIEQRKKHLHLSAEIASEEAEKSVDARTQEEKLSDEIDELKVNLNKATGRNIAIIQAKINEKQAELNTLNKPTQTPDTEDGSETQTSQPTESDFEGFEGVEYTSEPTESSTTVTAQSETTVSDTSVDTEVEPTPTTQSDIDATKAEIEKLEKDKQEELEATDLYQYDKKFKEFQTYGDTVKEAFDNLFEQVKNNPTNKKLSDLLDYINERLVPEDIRQDSDKNPLVKEYIDDNQQNINKANKSAKSRQSKISSKYDEQIAQKQAELKALEESTQNITPSQEESSGGKVDVRDVVFSRFQEGSKEKVPPHVTEAMNTSIQEAADFNNKDVSDTNFVDVLRYYVSIYGKEKIKQMVDKLALYWETTGRVELTPAYLSKIEKSLFSPTSLVIEFSETIEFEYADEAVTKTEEVEHKKEAPTVKFNPVTETHERESVLLENDKRTNKTDTKLAHRHSDSTRIDDTTWEKKTPYKPGNRNGTNLAPIHPNDPVQNRLILDKEFMHQASKEEGALTIKIHDIDTIPYGEKTWGEIKREKQNKLGVNTPEYKQWYQNNVPIYVRYKGEMSQNKPIFISAIHSSEWYVPKNMQNSDAMLAQEGKEKIMATRKTYFESGQEAMPINISKTSYGNVDRIRKVDKPVPISESNPQSTLAVIKKNSKGEYEITRAGQKVQIDNLETLKDILMQKGQGSMSIFIAPVHINEDGSQVFHGFPLMANNPNIDNPNLKGNTDPKIVDNVRVAFMADAISSNRNNKEVLDLLTNFFKEEFKLNPSLTSSDLLNIADNITKTISKDLGTSDIDVYVNLFLPAKMYNPTVNSETGEITKQDTTGVELNKGNVKFTGFNNNLKTPARKTYSLGGELKDSSGKMTSEQLVNAFISNFKTVLGQNGWIQNTTPYLNNRFLRNRENTVSIYGVENGIPVVKDSVTYEKFMQTVFTSNVISHEIERLDGSTTWAIDVQPMVYYELGPVEQVKKLQKNIAEVKKEEKPEEIKEVEKQEEFSGNQELLDDWNNIEAEIKKMFPDVSEQNLKTIKRQFTQKDNTVVETMSSIVEDKVIGKSNHITGLSYLEQIELVEMLKNKIVANLDLNKNLKSQVTSAIKNSLLTHLMPLIEEAENISTIYKTLGLTELEVVNNRNLQKLRTILVEQDKLIGDSGVIYSEFTNLLSEDLENFEQEDVSIEETFGKFAAEKDITLSFSAKLKMSFFGFNQHNTDGSTKINSMGVEIYHNANDIFERLIEITTTIPSDEVMLLSSLDLRRLNLEYVSNPLSYLYRDIIKKYKSLPTGLKNAILHKTISKRFNAEKTMISHMLREGVITEDKVSVIKEGLNTVNKSFNSIVSNFINNSDFTRIQIVETVEDGAKKEYQEIVLNEDYVDSFMPELLSFIAKYGTSDIDITNENVSDIFNMLEKMGITEISEQGIKTYLFEKKKLPEFFQGFYNSLAEVRSSPEKSNNIEENNPIKERHGQLKILLYAEMVANGTSVNSSVRVGEKTLQGIIANTSLYDINQSLTSENTYEETVGNYLLAPENKDNTILNLLLTDENFRQSFSRLAFSSPSAIGVQGKSDSDRTNIDELSPKDILMTKFGEYTSVAVDTKELTKETVDNLKDKTGLVFRIGKMASHTLSDKGRLLYMTNALVKFESNKEITFDSEGDIVLSDTLLDYLTQQIFESDLAKIKQVLNNSTGLKEYQDMASLFQTIPAFNSIQINSEGNNYTLPEYLAMTKGVIADKHKEIIYSEVKNQITNYVKSQTDKKISSDGLSGELVKFGMFNKTSNIALGIDSAYIKSYTNIKKGTDKLKAIRTIMAEFVTNNLLHNKLTHSIYLGDISFYAKTSFLSKVGTLNNEGKFIPVMDRITGEIDYQMLAKPQVYQALNKLIGAALDKRTASLIAPGYPLANSSTDMEGIATSIIHIAIKDSERASKIYLNTPGYENMNVADAQEYTTWRTHLDILYRKGDFEMSEEQYERIKKTIEQGKKLSKEDAHIFFQPIKPVYTGIIPHKLPDGSIVMRPIYNKSSSFPLLPEVVANTELDEVRKKLEALEFTPNGEFRHVRASFQSANKIGSLNTKLTFEQLATPGLGTIPQALLDTSMTILPMAGYKIQQENPSKEMKSYKSGKDAYITMGSQFMKIIMGDFTNHIPRPIFPNYFSKDTLEEFGVTVLKKYQGLENTEGLLTGQQLDEIYIGTYFKYNDLLRKGLEEELGLTDVDFNNLTIKNKNKILTNLQEIIKKEVKERGYPNYLNEVIKLIKDTDGQLSTINPIFFDSNTHKFESLLHAIIANRVITHKLPGNGHIAGSSEGFKAKKTYDDLTQEEKAGIIYNGDINTDNLAPTFITENGKLVKAEVFIPSHFKYTDVNGEYKYVDLSSDDYSENIVDKISGKIVGRRLLTERFDKELLSMFSFRIPTSSLQSGAIIEVKGFLPARMGDLIVVPAEHTVQLGEDFDIDKRFVYKNNYYVNDEENVKKLSYDKALLEEIREAAESLRDNINSLDSEEGGKVFEILENYKQTNEGINEQTLILLTEELRDLVNIGFKQNKQGNISNIDKVLKNIEMKMIENNIVDIYKSVYSTEDSEIQSFIRTPLETAVAEKTSFAMHDKLFGGQIDPYDSIMSDTYQTDLILLGADGKGGIGVHSNAVTFEAQLQRLTDKILTGDLSIDLRTGIPKFKPFTLNFISQEFDGVLGKRKKSLEGSRSITEHHAENQNVSTDNINKQIMAKRNENSYTMSVFALMAHMGIDLSIQEVQMSDTKKGKIHLPSVFMNQPILRRYVEIMKQFESVTEDFVDPKEKLSKVLEQLSKEFGFEPFTNKEGRITTPEFNNSSLRDVSPQFLWNMLPDAIGKAQGHTQRDILYTFLEMEKHSKMLSEIQQLFNISTNKLGVSHFESMQKLGVLNNVAYIATKMQSYGKTPYNGFERLIGEVSTSEKEGFEQIGDYYWKPTTIEGKMLINALSLSNKIMPTFFPYAKPAMRIVVGRIFNISDKDVSKKSKSGLKQKYEIMSSFKDYISASKSLYTNDLDSERKRLFFNYPGNQALGAILSKLKAEKNPIVNNKFIKDLEVSVNKFTNMVLIKHTAQESTTLDKSTKYDAFTALLNDNTILGTFNGETLTVSDFAKDLAIYAHLADNQNGATGFKNFVNTDYLEISGLSQTYRDTFKNLLQKDDLTDYELLMLDSFIEQYIQHYPNRAKVLKGRNKKEKEKAISETLATNGPKPLYVSFKIPKPKKGSGLDKDIKPYELYKFNSDTKAYEPIDVLGVNGYNEYNPNTINTVNTLIERRKVQNSSIQTPTQQDKPILKVIYETVGQNAGKLVVSGTNEVIEYSQYEDLFKTFDTVNKLNFFFKKDRLSDPTLDSTAKEFITTWHNLMDSLTPEVKAHLDTVEVKWLKSPEARNSFVLEENTIYFKTDILQKVALPAANYIFEDAQNVIKDIIFEEVSHAITFSALKDYYFEDNKGNIKLRQDVELPGYVKDLQAAYEAAAKVLPYDPTNPTDSNYFSKNIYEFVAGFLSNPEYRAKLEAQAPNLVQQMLKALEKMFRYLTGDISYTNTVAKSIRELMENKYSPKPVPTTIVRTTKDKLNDIKKDNPTDPVVDTSRPSVEVKNMTGPDGNMYSKKEIYEKFPDYYYNMPLTPEQIEEYQRTLGTIKLDSNLSPQQNIENIIKTLVPHRNFRDIMLNLQVNNLFHGNTLITQDILGGIMSFEHLNENPDRWSDEALGTIFNNIVNGIKAYSVLYGNTLGSTKSGDKQTETFGNPKDYANYSGGQLNGGITEGGDRAWYEVGKEFGVENHTFYKPQDYNALDANTKAMLDAQYKVVVNFLGRGLIGSNTIAGQLVRRDMMQANSADAIFGVTELIAPRVKGRKGYVNRKNYIVPEGGTAYAVARGVISKKPTYVFNQSSAYGVEIGWYKADSTAQNFVKIDTPVLTKNYAGVGTRELNEIGVQAIRDVYEKTFGKQTETNNNNLNEVGLTQSQTDFVKENKIEQNFYHNKPYAKEKDASGKVVKWEVYKTKTGESSMQGALSGNRTQTTRSPQQIQILENIAKNQGITNGITGTIVYMEGQVDNVKNSTNIQGGWFRITSEPYTPNKEDFNNYENWQNNVWNDRNSEFKIGQKNEWKSIRFEKIETENNNLNEATSTDNNVQETQSGKVVSRKSLLESLIEKGNNLQPVKGAVVEYNGTKWLLWNITDKNKAQLITTEGKKFSGTPNLDKLKVISYLPSTVYNGVDYIVTPNENVYSLATGVKVYTALDNSSKTQKERIIKQLLEENGLPSTTNLESRYNAIMSLPDIHKCK